jgi:hypothetical protein
MKALLIIGGVLIGLGVVSLAHFASPIRILLEASFGQQKLHLLIPTNEWRSDLDWRCYLVCRTA